jgi:hypothetical protein
MRHLLSAGLCSVCVISGGAEIMKLSVLKNKFDQYVIYLNDNRVFGNKPTGEETRCFDVILSSDIIKETLKSDCIECNGTGKKIVYNNITTCNICSGSGSNT